MKKRLLAGLTVGLMMFGGVAWATDNCATVDANLNANIPCVDVGGQYYQVRLNYNQNLIWGLGQVSGSTNNTNCAKYAFGTMGVSLPCVDVNGTEYSVNLNHYVDTANPLNFNWSLGDVQAIATTYTATAIAGTGGSVASSAITVDSGSEASFPVSTNTGYTKSNAVGGTCPAGTWDGDIYTTGVLERDCSVSFSFTALPQYTATATAGTGGSVTPSTISVTIGSGSTASFAVATSSGYTRNSAGGSCPLGSWNGDTYTTGAITYNCSVSFSFTAQYTVQLPQTGQTRCYNVEGGPIDCDGTGQDGEMMMGEPWPIPRFTDHRNGSITDNLTGLVWTRNAGTPELGRCKGGPMDWEESFVYAKCANSDNYAGYSDWRVPNINELRSLANIGYNEQPADFLSSWLQSQGFINVQRESYWASTRYAGDEVSGWCVYLWNGYTNYNFRIMDYYVWLVRGGQKSAPAAVFKTGQTKSLYPRDDADLHQGVAWPNPRFTDKRNGTVLDNLTGLIWLKNADCRDTFAGIPKDQGYMSREKAFAWTSNLASGACGLRDDSTPGDWRIPNREELESLIDFEYIDPPLSNTTGTGHWSEGDPFTNVQKAFYWSSSTDFKAPYGQNGITHFRGAWVVYMWSASVGSIKNTNVSFVWPVRGGDQ